jgi:hypothetical protein
VVPLGVLDRYRTFFLLLLSGFFSFGRSVSGFWDFGDFTLSLGLVDLGERVVRSCVVLSLNFLDSKKLSAKSSKRGMSTSVLSTDGSSSVFAYFPSNSMLTRLRRVQIYRSVLCPCEPECVVLIDVLGLAGILTSGRFSDGCDLRLVRGRSEAPMSNVANGRSGSSSNNSRATGLLDYRFRVDLSNPLSVFRI